MKTLKKTLCLVLAVVMAVGVLVIPASAVDYDDYTDVAEIDHPIAVEVLTTLGILNGNDDGAFAPDEILTRAQGAKILVETILGSNAKYLDNSSSIFSDVKAGNWAAGYIAYAASQGIIDGVGNGKFAPDEQLTGYQFAKLLLVAMGVDGDYVGTNWKIDVGLNAARYILDDLDDIVLSDPISREDAAQMAFNALLADVTGTTETIYTVTLDHAAVADDPATEADESKAAWTETLYSGTNETIAMAYTIQNAGAKIVSRNTVVGSLGYDLYKLEVNHSAQDVFGRPRVSYVADGKTIVNVDDVAGKTYNASVSSTKIGVDMGISSATKAYALNVYVDGALSAQSGVYTRGQATPVSFGGYGATVEVYSVGTSSAPVFDVIVVNTYGRKLTANDIKKATTAGDDHDAVPAHIVLEWNGTAEALTYPTTEYKKDNVVLYTKADGKVQSLELATAVTGKITRYNAGKNVTVNGNVYNFDATTYNVNPDAIIPTGMADLFDTDFVFYTDSRNNVYGRDIVAAANVTNVDGYVYVKNYQVKASGSNGDLFEDYVADSYAVKATVMGVDGASKVVDLAVTTTTSGDVTSFFCNLPGAVNGAVANTQLTISTRSNDVNKWVGYTVNEAGEYVLQGVTGVAAVADVTKATKSSNVVTVGADPKVMISTSTYNVINTKTAKVSTTTGYSNIQISTTLDDALVLFTDSSKAIVKAVYTVTNVDDSTTPLDYAYVASIGSSVKDGTEVTFYVGGEKVVYAVPAGMTVVKDHVYAIEVGADGIVDSVAEQTVGLDKKTVSYIDAGFILYEAGAEGTAGDQTVVLNSKTVVYNVTSDGAGAVDTLEVGDQVSIVLTDDAVATAAAIFIVG